MYAMDECGAHKAQYAMHAPPTEFNVWNGVTQRAADLKGAGPRYLLRHGGRKPNCEADGHRKDADHKGGGARNLLSR